MTWACRPSNIGLLPTRSTVLCDHVAEARGSFAALYGANLFSVCQMIVFEATQVSGFKRPRRAGQCSQSYQLMT